MDRDVREVLEGDIATRTPRWCHEVANLILTIAARAAGKPEDFYNDSVTTVAQLIHLKREGYENGGEPIRGIKEG